MKPTKAEAAAEIKIGAPHQSRAIIDRLEAMGVEFAPEPPSWRELAIERAREAMRRVGEREGAADRYPLVEYIVEVADECGWVELDPGFDPEPLADWEGDVLRKSAEAWLISELEDARQEARDCFDHVSIRDERADAWNEGYQAGWDDGARQDERLDRDDGALYLDTPNPYRKGENE